MGGVEFILGVFFATGIAVGMGVVAMATTKYEFYFSEACFAGSCISVLFAYLLWMHEQQRPLFLAIVLGLVVFLIVLFGLPQSIRWVIEKQRLKISELAAASEPEPILPPSVVLMYEAPKLKLDNLGRTEIFLWGNHIEGDLPIIEDEARTIFPGYHYYWLNDNLQKWLLKLIGQNGERLLKYDTYLCDKNDKQYTANFKLLVKIKDGNIEMHTQQMGIVEGGWPPIRRSSHPNPVS
jgi:hypothetical protein